MRSVLMLTRSWVALAIISCGSWAMSPSVVAAEQPVAIDDATTMPLGLGGVGGVYLAAEPGELVIEVQKRDRHRGRAVTELRAILAGPDRHVLREVTIPDDGRPAGSGLGPVQRTHLSARVPRSGVYALNVTVSNDRYGEEAIWGFTTNCPHYVIETARGHKDERHQEPIVFGRVGVRSRRCVACGLSVVAAAAAAVPTQSPCDARLPTQTAGRSVGATAGPDRPALL